MLPFLLAPASAVQSEVCQLFSLSMARPASGAQASLSDLCQQDIQIVNEAGDVLFDQAATGPSCL